MTAKAKAAVLIGPRQIEIQEFPLPEIGPEEGLLRVEGCGICGADLSPFAKGAHGRYQVPLILGHEPVGLIERIGSEAAKRWRVKEGDRVVLEEHLPCRVCEPCRRGHFSGCLAPGSHTGARWYGTTPTSIGPALWGGYSEYMYLDPRAVITKISHSVPVELAALFIPISNGFYLVQDAGEAKVGSTVVVIGPGQHGLGCVIGAREAEVGCVILIGLSRDARRLEVGRELGADYTLCVDTENVTERVKAITGGGMADVVINTAAGAPGALETAIDLAAQRGTVVTLTGEGPAAGINPEKLGRKTIKAAGGRDRRAMRAAIHLIESGTYPLEKLCTHAFPIEETARGLKTAAWEGDPDPIHVSILNV